jgi:hypothetical protein
VPWTTYSTWPPSTGARCMCRASGIARHYAPCVRADGSAVRRRGRRLQILSPNSIVVLSAHNPGVGKLSRIALTNEARDSTKNRSEWSSETTTDNTPAGYRRMPQPQSTQHGRSSRSGQDEMWNVACRDGNEFAISLKNDANGSTKCCRVTCYELWPRQIASRNTDRLSGLRKAATICQRSVGVDRSLSSDRSAS